MQALTDKCFGPEDVKVTRRSTGYRGFFSIDTIRLSRRLSAGGWSQEFERELFTRDPAAGVLLYDPDRPEVVMVEQFRVGILPDAESDGVSPWGLAIAAGIIDPGGSAEELAHRESMEGAGRAETDLIHITHYYNSTGPRTEPITQYR